VLGSPIRTPPDQRFVANSPGLIAGSYVLHRLLMPRHPPCALHSLSHKHSTKTTNQPVTTTNITTSVCCLAATKNKNHRPEPITSGPTRCSRPLSNYQHTNPPTPANNRKPCRSWTKEASRSVIPQSPTVCQNLIPTPPPPRFHSHPQQHQEQAVLRAGSNARTSIHRRFH
jgi:hypothetical protein